MGFSGGEEFSLSLHPLFTPLHPYRNTLYAIWGKKRGKSMAVWENNRKFAIGKQRLGIMIETNDRILPVGIL
jgi:hypothetical protein